SWLFRWWCPCWKSVLADQVPRPPAARSRLFIHVRWPPREVLAKDLPLEQSRRLTNLLARLNPDEPTPQRLFEIRAVEVLEYLASPESRGCLERLAKGAPQARLTTDARAALDRIARREKARL